ncbi:hypothetical protein ABZ370_15485 [Streptomyces sp. NPDC005962]|uniref:hypothetical protein n=1 Tax=Streptomyces sp. NPDC005962 TaxID=3154466 RepID=UPI00340E3335
MTARHGTAVCGLRTNELAPQSPADGVAQPVVGSVGTENGYARTYGLDPVATVVT